MADALPATNYYSNLGGINQKASQYDMPIAQFLNLRNVDFDTPKALQKRPGSSLWSAAAITGPVLGLFEYQKLFLSNQVQSDYILASTNNALFYNTPQSGTNPTAFSLLADGWTANQPADMLVFANRAWATNGQRWQWFDGISLYPVGLPGPKSVTLFPYGGPANRRDYLVNPASTDYAGSYFLVMGATNLAQQAGGAAVPSGDVYRGLYLAYSYLRNDGYQGPVDFQNTARNMVYWVNPPNGTEFLTSANASLANHFGGFTVPAGYGISGICLWFAVDTATLGSPTENIPGSGNGATNGFAARGLRPCGALGFVDGPTYGIGEQFLSYTLKPGADLDRFWFYGIIPAASLILTNNGFATYYAMPTFSPGGSFANYDGVAGPGSAFSAMPFDFFATYIPKYQEINQNTMFIAGFSVAPSVVWPSAVGSPETYDPEASFEVRTNDGDVIRATASYQNNLLIMKENSFHKLIGDSADNYQLIQISEQYGCISNKSVVQYDQKILWLDKKGVLEFNGANQEIISGPVEGIFRRMNLPAARELAVGIHNIDRNQLWWGIPIDGSSVNNITVVYDYLVGAWTFFDGFSPSSFAVIRGQLSKQTVWRGDYSGFIHFTGSSFYNDSGSGISCVIQPRYENVGGQNQTTLWRRFFLDVASVSGLTGSIGGKVFANYDSSTVQATFTIYQSQFQSRAEMGVLGKAVSVELSHYSASLPLLINGFAWSQRGLRNV
jgi:hypothetical protein